jgi:hypothetical protein
MDYRTHVCGGTILSGGSGEQAHIYCDRCSAFTHDADDIEANRLPSGTDKALNQQASDDGAESSPEAE